MSEPGSSVGRMGFTSAWAITAHTAPGSHVDEVCAGGADPAFHVLDDVWDGQNEETAFFSIHRKEYAVSSLFHALGPARAALLPGWCGTFLLTPEQVAESLTAVERAFALAPEDRAAAEARDWLSYDAGEESVLDGPPRVWRTAADRGLGLCGVSVHLS